jgi:hypothetical protein
VRAAWGFRAIGVEIAHTFKIGQAEHAIFDAANAIEASLLTSRRWFGRVRVREEFRDGGLNDFAGKGVELAEVVGWQDDNASGEAVTIGIEGGSGACPPGWLARERDRHWRDWLRAAQRSLETFDVLCK